MSLTCHIVLLTLFLRCYCVAGFLRGMLYPRESETRQVKSLDGMWDFRADVSSVGFEEMWYSLPLAQVNWSRSTNKIFFLWCSHRYKSTGLSLCMWTGKGNQLTWRSLWRIVYRNRLLFLFYRCAVTLSASLLQCFRIFLILVYVFGWKFVYALQQST